MAKHNVYFSVPQHELGKVDVEFDIQTDGARAGKLAISNGSVVWFPKGTVYGYKMGWKKFDQMMRENADRLERRK